MTTTMMTSRMGVSGSLASQTSNLNNGSVASVPSSVEAEGSYSDAEPVDITVALPDGTPKTFQVEMRKSLMDLLVQVAAGNRLSPAAHTFQIRPSDPPGARCIEYQPSQTVGGLLNAHQGETLLLQLLPKAKVAEFTIERQRRETQGLTNQPFEKTRRLTVNLPRNQKMVLRVNPQTPLGQVCGQVCAEKGLDPRSMEVRHPRDRDTVLSLSHSLDHYGLQEITLCAASGPERAQSELNLSRSSGYEFGQSTMPKKKATDDPGEGYMPEFTQKKKKGFLSRIFSKRKEGNFKPVSEESSHGKQRLSHNLSGSTPSLNNNQRLSAAPAAPVSSRHGSVSGSVSSSRPGSVSAPAKPPRKKRMAPAPPGQVPQNGSVYAAEEPVTARVDIKMDHSRTSSHSSGFAEEAAGASSPLSSPPSSRDHPAAASGPPVSRRHVSGHVGGEPANAAHSKKKRRAPAPPGITAPGVSGAYTPALAISGHSDTDSTPSPREQLMSGETDPQGGVTPETHDLSESGVVLLASRDSQSESGLSTTASDSQSDTSEHSHSKPRPLLFFPPPPDTPPPPNLSPDPHVQRVGSPCGSEVVDSSTQVHVSARDSLSSEPYSRAQSMISNASIDIEDHHDGPSKTRGITDPDENPGLDIYVAEIEEMTVNANLDRRTSPRVQLPSDSTTPDGERKLVWARKISVSSSSSSSARSSIHSSPTFEKKFVLEPALAGETDVVLLNSTRIEDGTQGVAELDEALQAFDEIEYNNSSSSRWDKEVAPVPPPPAYVSVVQVGAPDDSEESMAFTEEITFEESSIVYVPPEHDGDQDMSVGLEDIHKSQRERKNSASSSASSSVNIDSISTPTKSSPAASDHEDDEMVAQLDEDNRLNLQAEYLLHPSRLPKSQSDWPKDFGLPPLSPNKKKVEKTEEPKIRSLRQAYGKPPGIQGPQHGTSVIYRAYTNPTNVRPNTYPSSHDVESNKKRIGVDASLMLMEDDLEVEEAPAAFSLHDHHINKANAQRQNEWHFDESHFSAHTTKEPAEMEKKKISVEPTFTQIDASDDIELPSDTIRRVSTSSVASAASTASLPSPKVVRRGDEHHQSSIISMEPVDQPKRKIAVDTSLLSFNDSFGSGENSPASARSPRSISPVAMESSNLVHHEPAVVGLDNYKSDSFEGVGHLPEHPADNLTKDDSYKIYRPRHTQRPRIVRSPGGTIDFDQSNSTRDNKEFARREYTADDTRTGDLSEHITDNNTLTVQSPTAIPSFTETNVKKSNEDFSFFAPRPFGARTRSEPSVRDIRTALQIHQNSPESSTPSKQDDVREQCSEISFTPRSEEEHQSFMEDKSISQIALPAERQPQVVHSSRPVQVSTRQEVSAEMPIKSCLKTTTSTTTPQPESKEKAKKSLQKQYNELQQQFGKWQKQIAENQALLSKQNEPAVVENSVVPESSSRARSEPPASHDQAPTGLRPTGSVSTGELPFVARLRQNRSERPVSLKEPPTVSAVDSSDYAVIRSRLRHNATKERVSLKFGAGTMTVLHGPEGQPSPTFGARPHSVADPGGYRSGSPASSDTSDQSTSNPSSHWQTHGRQAPPAQKAMPTGKPPAAPTQAQKHPPSPTTAQVANQFGGAIKSSRPNMKRFEPKLDPREELMISIRNAKGRNALRTVTVEEANWTPTES